MREQFPFLYEADCPREFLELYAKKKVARDNYLHHHKQLRDNYYDDDGNRKLTPELPNGAVFPIALKTLDSWVENQMIYAEMNHYQAEKKILGVHPVFRDLLLKEKIGKMRELNAYKRKENLDHYVRRDLKKLAKIKDAEARTKFESKIKEWQHEIELINTIHKFE